MHGTMEVPGRKLARVQPPLGGKLARVPPSKLPPEVIRHILEYVLGGSLHDPVLFHTNTEYIMNVYYLLMDHARMIDIRPVMSTPLPMIPSAPSVGEVAVVTPERGLWSLRNSTTTELRIRVWMVGNNLMVLGPGNGRQWKRANLTADYIREMAKLFPQLVCIRFGFSRDYAQTIHDLSQVMSSFDEEVSEQGVQKRDLNLQLRSFWVVFDTPDFTSWGGTKPWLLHLKTNRIPRISNIFNKHREPVDIGLDFTGNPLNLQFGPDVYEVDSIGNATTVRFDPLPTHRLLMQDWDCLRDSTTLTKIVDMAPDLKSARFPTIPNNFLAGSVHFREFVSPGPSMIGSRAFAGSGISRISFDNCTYIYDGAFSGCVRMRAVAFQYLYEGFSYITKASVYECVSVGEEAFLGCTGLESVTGFANAIGKRAFLGCTGLTTLRLNKSDGVGISALGADVLVEEEAFRGCVSLTTLDLSYVSCGVGVFSDCTGLTDVSISDVRTLRSDLFSNCTFLKQFTGKRIGRIQSNAFYGCTALSTVMLKNVGTISAGAFPQHDGAISSITLQEVDILEETVFSRCPELKSVKMRSGVIPVRAFANCPKLERVIGHNISSIEPRAFQQCGTATDNGTKVDLLNDRITITVAKDAFKDMKGEVTRRTERRRKPANS